MFDRVSILGPDQSTDSASCRLIAARIVRSATSAVVVWVQARVAHNFPSGNGNKKSPGSEFGEGGHEHAE